MTSNFVLETLKNICKQKQEYKAINRLRIFLSFINKNMDKNSILEIHDFIYQLPSSPLKKYGLKSLRKYFYQYWMSSKIKKEDSFLIDIYYNYFSAKEQVKFTIKLNNDLPELSDFTSQHHTKKLSPLTEALNDVKINKYEKYKQYIQKIDSISKIEYVRIINIFNKLNFINILPFVSLALKKHLNSKTFNVFNYISYIYLKPHFLSYPHSDFKIYYETLTQSFYLYKDNNITSSEVHQNINKIIFQNLSQNDEFNLKNYDICSFCYNVMYHFFTNSSQNYTNAIENINYLFAQNIPYLKKIAKKYHLDLSNNGLLELYLHCYSLHPPEDSMILYNLDDYNSECLVYINNAKILLHEYKLNNSLLVKQNNKTTIHKI